jgi:hypothetical protein
LGRAAETLGAGVADWRRGSFTVAEGTEEFAEGCDGCPGIEGSEPGLGIGTGVTLGGARADGPAAEAAKALPSSCLPALGLTVVAMAGG